MSDQNLEHRIIELEARIEQLESGIQSSLDQLQVAIIKSTKELEATFKKHLKAWFIQNLN